ncbi:unnamed protein product [Miscanthus lutarioriparius]|uniref:DUF4283 domain-containing protein n=1 Tax=Miscanthus lutarioriparius TaxID=422564 RepID=A0A811PSR7_9POAL|nr:unnamed protein product [Miscanthus lutarioriparius]
MARPGDPTVRPLDTCAVAFSIDNMDQELDRLSMHGMVAWLGGNRPVVEPDVIKRAICHQFPIRPEDVTVVRHAPKDFFIDFKHRHHRDEAVAQGTFPYRNLDIHTRPWQLVTHGDICDLKYRVRLCLEGISLHAWNESIARACDLDYVEKASLDRADTRALCVWAWTYNLSNIPKAPKDCERERSESRHGGRRHRSLEHGGRRHPLDDVAAGQGTRLSAPSDAAGHGANVTARQLLAKPADPGRSGMYSAEPGVAVAPVSDHDNTTQQRSHLAAESRFRTGRVYSRRPCVPHTHRKQAQPTGSTQGLVRQPSPPQRCKRPPVLARSSVRIAAMNWPRGDTQVKARQVLMKRLGILDVEGLSHDEALLCYFNLFKGPLTDNAVKALTALCGLDAAAALPTTHA